MNSTSPSRIRAYSSAMGSLTLSTMSTPPFVPHASSGVSTILAPAARYSSSLIEEPTPAFFSMTTSWPWATSSCTPMGVMATRYSWFLTSLGTPTFTEPTLVPSRLAAD